MTAPRRGAALEPTAWRRAGWAALAAALAALVLTAWVVTSSPAMPFLSARGPASWIVYPRPGDTWPHKMVELPGRFTRSFDLASAPPTVRLRLRAFRRASVEVNGQPVALSEAATWKGERQADVAPLLRSGPNRIAVEVSNDIGPPALWLALELPGSALATDPRWEASWAGATSRPAALATDPMPGDRSDPLHLAPAPLEALRIHRRLLLAFACLSAAMVGTFALARRRWPGLPLWAEGSPWLPRLALAVVSLLWVALFVNNAGPLPLRAGFDAEGHIEYVQYVLERHAIPLADEGWQTFQPPLYYLLVAGALAATGTALDGAGAVWVIRMLGLGIGLAHLWLVASGLRLLFPGQARRQVLGVIVAAFLPPMLSMHQFVGNEPLMAALSSGALVVALLALRDPPRLSREILLGVLLGLALLAKVSALLLLPPIFGALLVRAALDAAARRRRLLGLAAAAAALLATSAWYFGRVWMRFGTPFVGGWDPHRGFAWWQDPGYRTLDDFLRFGRALAQPLYAGFNGFWDGLYATLWGDGLLAGQGEVRLIPHWWSISLMSAGIVLALAPCLAVLVGCGATLARWVRKPAASRGVVLGLAALVLDAMALMSIQVPSVVSDKASYGLLALLAFGVFAAVGLDGAMRPGRWAALAVAVGLGTWALTAYATHWIDGASPGYQLIRARDLLARGRAKEGVRTFVETLRLEPGAWAARLALAEMMLDRGAPRDEVARTLQGGANPPEIEWRHYLLSRLAEREGDADGALVEVLRALAIDPDQPDNRARLATLLQERGALQGAVVAWREVLRIDPQRKEAHRALASLYQRTGDPEAAARHLDWSERLARAR